MAQYYCVSTFPNTWNATVLKDWPEDPPTLETLYGTEHSPKKSSIIYSFQELSLPIYIESKEKDMCKTIK